MTLFIQQMNGKEAKEGAGGLNTGTVQSAQSRTWKILQPK